MDTDAISDSSALPLQTALPRASSLPALALLLQQFASRNQHDESSDLYEVCWNLSLEA